MKTCFTGSNRLPAMTVSCRIQQLAMFEESLLCSAPGESQGQIA
jgi:hypothetical protein